MPHAGSRGADTRPGSRYSAYVDTANLRTAKKLAMSTSVGLQIQYGGHARGVFDMGQGRIQSLDRQGKFSRARASEKEGWTRLLVAPQLAGTATDRLAC